MRAPAFARNTTTSTDRQTATLKQSQLEWKKFCSTNTEKCNGNEWQRKRRQKKRKRLSSSSGGSTKKCKYTNRLRNVNGLNLQRNNCFENGFVQVRVCVCVYNSNWLIASKYGTVCMHCLSSSRAHKQTDTNKTREREWYELERRFPAKKIWINWEIRLKADTSHFALHAMRHAYQVRCAIKRAQWKS